MVSEKALAFQLCGREFPQRWEALKQVLLGGKGGFPGGSVVKNLPAMQELLEMWIQCLGGEEPPKKGMATHSSILAWRISIDRGD